MFVSTRRGFLKAAAVGLAAPCAFTQTPQITTTELAPNLFLLSGAGANVLARTGTGTGDNTVVLVDGGFAQNAAA